MKLKIVAFAVVLLCSIGGPVIAQVGSTTDILMGRVAGLDSQAIPNARVEATSLETGITRTKTTGADGRYTIVFPDGGGKYTLTVRAVGLSPVTRTVSRQGDEDRRRCSEGAHDASRANAFLDIIAINDSAKLDLTPDQVAKLQTSGDAFKVKADSLIDKVANMLADTPVKNPDPMTVFAKLQPSMAEGREASDPGDHRSQGDPDAGAVGKGAGQRQNPGSQA